MIARLGAGGDRHFRTSAINARHFHMAPHGGLRHAQRHPHQNIRAIALENRMRPDRDINIEITRGRAALPGFPFARQANTRAIINPSRDRDIQAAFALHAPRSAANLARIFDAAPGAAASWAGALHQEKPLLRPDLAIALAGAAGLHTGCRTTFRANTLTGFAGNAGGEADSLLSAGESFFQRNLHLRAQIRTAPRSRALTAPAAAKAAEHFFENIFKAAAAKGATATKAATTARPALLKGGMTETVISGALFGILQHIVSLVQFLELGFGFCIALIAVRVPLHRKLAIGFLEVILARIARDAENLVIIAFCHGRATLAAE